MLAWRVNIDISPLIQILCENTDCSNNIIIAITVTIEHVDAEKEPNFNLRILLKRQTSAQKREYIWV